MSLKFYLRAFVSTLLFSILCGSGFAQQSRQISGTVHDTDAKTPFAGVAVTVKGTNVGAITDIKGAYKIKAKDTDILVFQYLGYDNKEVKVGTQSVINAILMPKAQEISEVVVTALGLTREQKSLGYAVSKIDNAALTNVVSGNWLNGMAGKVAGLNFDSASSGPGGSVRVTLRGESSLSHDNNEALFVVDGVPISSGMTGSGGSAYSETNAPVDFGNGAGDLNPDDIESVSVLKGPAATALYGSRAANGAIIVTTKSGRTTKGVGVTFNSSVTFEKAGFWPDFQDEYGSGDAITKNTEYGADARRYYSFWNVSGKESADGLEYKRLQSRKSFGPRYEGQMFYQYDSYGWETGTYTPLPWKAQDWYKGFFETGVTYTNSISVDGSSGKGTSVRVSVKDTRNDWIVPNSGYTSQNFNISLSQKVSKSVSVDAKVTYYRKNSDNLPVTGYSQASPLYALIWNQSSVSINSYYDEWSSGRLEQLFKDNVGGGTLFTNGGATINNASASARSENVYWLAHENINTMDRDRVYGNISVRANLAKGLDLTVRSGMDFGQDFRTQQKPQYSYEYADGFYREQHVSTFEMNNDFLFSYKNTFGDLSLSASLGGNNMVNNYRTVSVTADKLSEPNVFIMQNSLNPPTVRPSRSNKSVNSFYGVASLGWKDYLYLDLTGRNDWTSTLAPGNNSYFYPSVSASVLLDQIFNFRTKASWVNMLKLRASWANVGNDTDPYTLNSVYSNGSFASSYYLNNTMQNYNIRPENVESWEFGLETKLFNNRWTLDAAFYNSTTTDQIIPVPTDKITGAGYQVINAGEVNNKGIELSTRIQAIKKKDFSWTINLNWSKNWNKLVELAPGVDVWQLNTATTIGSRVYIYAYPGQELGRIYGWKYERAPKGSYYTDASGNKIDCSGMEIVDQKGFPVLDKNNFRDLGSIYPDWKAGMSHTIQYKNFRLDMTFTGQVGGNCYSVTNFGLSYQGKLKNSLPGRYEGLVHKGVNRLPDGTYQPNTTITSNIAEYYGEVVWNRENGENNTFDTSFLKFKEARLDYSLPAKVCKQLGFLQAASIGVYATNIFCITNFPQYDPEAAALNGSSISRGIEIGGYPMTRTVGVNVKLTF